MLLRKDGAWRQREAYADLLPFGRSGRILKGDHCRKVPLEPPFGYFRAAPKESGARRRETPP